MFVAVRDSQLNHAQDNADRFAVLKRLGVGAVEVMVPQDLKTTGFAMKDGQPYDLAIEASELKAACDAHGVKVCGLLLGNRFEKDDGEQTEWLVKAIEAADILGAAAVRVDVVAREMEPPAFMKKAVKIIQSALSQTESTGMPLGVENHGKTSNRVEFLRELFDAVGSDRFGLTLDTGNFYWYGYPLERVYEIMEEVAPRVKHTHVKNINYPEAERARQREPGWEYGKYVSPVPDGDIDHKRVADILKKAGYAGAFTLEDESYGHFDAATQDANLVRNVKHLSEVV